MAIDGGTITTEVAVDLTPTLKMLEQVAALTERYTLRPYAVYLVLQDEERAWSRVMFAVARDAKHAHEAIYRQLVKEGLHTKIASDIKVLALDRYIEGVYTVFDGGAHE